MKNETTDQKTEIVNYLMLGLTLDPRDAWKKFGTLKLSTRLSEIEKEGKLPKVYRQRKTALNRYGNTVSFMTHSIVKPKSNLGLS